MGIPQRARGSFKTLKFPKLGKEIIEAAMATKDAVAEKIDDRQKRISRLCEEKGLSVADFFNNADEFYNNSTAYGVQAGELAQLREESMHIQNEKAVLKELDLIIHNLPPEESFDLTFEDLTYFGF